MEIRAVAVDRILDLRQRVLRPGLPRDAAGFEGDEEAETVHLAAFDATGAVIGCATLLRRVFADATWQLRGMAVDDAQRGRGVGAALLAAAERQARPEGLWCNARTAAAPFYVRHGWERVGEVFEIAGVGPHIRMRRCFVRQ